jgi:16S rRNA (cytidine1402-2'-O)-methyltransferase
VSESAAGDPPARAQPGTLYLIPNLLGAVTPDAVLPARTLAIARHLERFVVETPKVARAFLKTLGAARAIHGLQISVLDEHTPRDAVDALAAPLLAGHDIGLISDAGTPAVADPGALLVAAAHACGARVVPLVGPSAILLALMACGMDGQRFEFHGYLPAKPGARAERLRAIDAAVAREGATHVFIETPYRNDAMIASVLEACAARTIFCFACDLTLNTESIVRRSVGAWKRAPVATFARRPAIFLLGRAP